MRRCNPAERGMDDCATGGDVIGPSFADADCFMCDAGPGSGSRRVGLDIHDRSPVPAVSDRMSASDDAMHPRLVRPGSG